MVFMETDWSEECKAGGGGGETGASNVTSQRKVTFAVQLKVMH